MGRPACVQFALGRTADAALMDHRGDQRAVRRRQPDHGALADRIVSRFRLRADLSAVAPNSRQRSGGLVRRRLVPRLPAGDPFLRADHRRPAARGVVVLRLLFVVGRKRARIDRLRTLACGRGGAGVRRLAERAAADRLFRARGRPLHSRLALVAANSRADPGGRDLRAAARRLVRGDLHAGRRSDLGRLYAGACGAALFRSGRSGFRLLGEILPAALLAAAFLIARSGAQRALPGRQSPVPVSSRRWHATPSSPRS